MARWLRLLGCGRDTGWRLGDGRYMCSKCGSRTSVTRSLTGSRTPLTVWFTACGLFATGKDGISARLEDAGDRFLPDRVGRCCDRLRSVQTGRARGSRRSSAVQESGLRGGRARGKKVLTGIEPTGLGRCRMRPLAMRRPSRARPSCPITSSHWARESQRRAGATRWLDPETRLRPPAGRPSDPHGEDPGCPGRCTWIASLIKRWLLGWRPGLGRRTWAATSGACSASTLPQPRSMIQSSPSRTTRCATETSSLTPHPK